jgi:ARG and Rhodanese-Phosphatase-superfamily-associated Protein domain
MKSITIVIFLSLPLFCFSQYTYNNLQVNFLETETAVKIMTYQNLRLYPIYAKETFITQFKNVGKYMPLTEAIEKKKVLITEKKNGGEVNDLVIENISHDTIIVICGDIVKGGKQDRIAQQDMLLKPKSGKRDMKVFCVESGRWQSRSNADALHTRANNAYSAEKAEVFNGHFNKGSMGLRKVVEKYKDQSKVWSKVDEINNNNKTTTETKTYTAINSSNDYSKKLKGYVDFFRAKFDSDSNIIGVVVVSGDKVLGCDMFATPAIFKSQFVSLLYSYATEAILNGKTVTATTATVKAYMNPLLNNETSQQVTLKQKGNDFVEKGKKLRVSSFD